MENGENSHQAGNPNNQQSGAGLTSDEQQTMESNTQELSNDEIENPQTINEVNVQNTQTSELPTSEGGHTWNFSMGGAQNPVNNHIVGINMTDLISDIGSENNQSKGQGNGSSIVEVNTNVIINLPSFWGNNGQERTRAARLEMFDSLRNLAGTRVVKGRESFGGG